MARVMCMETIANDFRVLGSAVRANSGALPVVATALQQIGHELSDFILRLL